MAAHLIGRGQQNLAMDFLDRPAVLDKLYCQIIQQLRMTWPIASKAEVAQAAYQSRAKMLMPDAVHHNPCCQRIRGTRNLVGQIQSTASSLKRRRGSIGEHGKKMTWNRFPEIVRIAAPVEGH